MTAGRGRPGAAAAGAAGAAMALVLAGCWPAPGQGPDRQSDNPFESTITVDTVASLAEDWTVDTGDADAGAPIVTPDGVHVRGGTVLHTLDAADGHERWAFDPQVPSPVGQMSDPIWQDGRIYVGYGYPNLGGHWQAKALDASSGASVLDIGGALVDSVRGSTVAQSWLAFGSSTPIAVGLMVSGDVDDPATTWNGFIDLGEAGSGVARVPATVGKEGVLHAGRGLLTTTPSTSPATGNGVRSFSIGRPANCYTGGDFPYFPCPTWATPVDGAVSSPPVIGANGDLVYAGTGAGTMYALYTSDGLGLWTASVGAAITASPALSGGTLFVPTADGDLVALDAQTGDALWTARTGSALTVQPAVAGGVVYTGSADGSVRAYPAAGCGAATCHPLWSASTGSRITGAPAVSGGRLYVGTQDGRVVAYAPS
jgi:outer membrane protein assembly factor BamB